MANGEKDETPLQSAWEERPLDPGERRVFRQMRKDWEWWNTVWGLVRRISLWALGVAGAIWTSREIIGKMLKAITQP